MKKRGNKVFCGTGVGSRKTRATRHDCLLFPMSAGPAGLSRPVEGPRSALLSCPSAAGAWIPSRSSRLRVRCSSACSFGCRFRVLAVEGVNNAEAPSRPPPQQRLLLQVGYNPSRYPRAEEGSLCFVSRFLILRKGQAGAYPRACGGPGVKSFSLDREWYCAEKEMDSPASTHVTRSEGDGGPLVKDPKINRVGKRGHEASAGGKQATGMEKVSKEEKKAPKNPKGWETGTGQLEKSRGSVGVVCQIGRLREEKYDVVSREEGNSLWTTHTTSTGRGTCSRTGRMVVHKVLMGTRVCRGVFGTRPG